MQYKSLEISVGLFVSIAIAALFFLALHVSNFSNFNQKGSYTIQAHFENVSGLKVKAVVSMAGVPIGRVSTIDFDEKNYNALIKMNIDSRYQAIPTDTSASIYTAGLLGEKYIGLSAGGLDEFLHDGDTIELTQSSLILEQLISKFLFSSSKK